MPQRSKSSNSLQSEGFPRGRAKKLRLDSDEEQDENFEPHQERGTASYNEFYTRDAGQSSSPLSEPTTSPMSTTKRQKANVSSPEHDEASMTDHNDDDGGDDDDNKNNDNGDDESYSTYPEHGEDEYDEYGTSGRLGKKRRGEPSSPSARRQSSPPTAVTAPTLVPQATSTSTKGGVRRPSIKAKYITATTTNPPATTTTSSIPANKKPIMKGNQKASTSTKRKRKEEEDSQEEDEYYSYDDEEVNVEDEDEEDEARLSEEEDDHEEHARGKKGRGGGIHGRGKAREREKEKDMATVLKKAKFEGNLTGTKRLRAKTLAEDDTVVDIMDESGTPEASALGSPTTATGADAPTTNVPPAKKRKLPMIKKLKSTGAVTGVVADNTSTGSHTPNSGLPQGSKPSVLAPPTSISGTGGSTTSKLGIGPAGGSTRPKTNATTDLDLSNPSLYAELFKNPGGNASRTGLNRRAKEEERKKELDRMRDEYKRRFEENVKMTFDLQGQAEKMARFEEVLRQRRSSALYPNFLAAKWREESEREKRRLHHLQYQQHQAQVNGQADNTKEEGEM